MKSISRRLFHFLDLWTEDVEQIGIVVALVFFLLLFQSNITKLELHRRHVKEFTLLTVALFHFLHAILEPQLLKTAMQTLITTTAFIQIDENQQNQNK